MPHPASLADILTLAEVQSLAGPKTFARGKAYFHDGVVSRLEVREDAVHASVQGTHRYSVELGVGRHGQLAYECNCPVGDDGIFCKHAVAVALSWLENSGAEVFHADDAEPVKRHKKRKTYVELIREYLATLGENALRELLLDAAGRDVSLRDQLLFAARTASADDLPSLKTAVRQATRIRRPLAWDEAGAYGDGLMSLAAMLRQRLVGPHAAQVVELAELAIAGAEESLQQIDDSNGEVMPGIRELADVHLEACAQTRPDPVKLAERLFRFQMEGPWDTFYDVLPAYAEPLGDAGLRRYRELVGKSWEALPALVADDESDSAFDSKRMTLEHAMEALAEFDGDIDALIRIASKDLSSPYRFLHLAALCAQHGRADEGLAWAERGLAKWEPAADPRLLDFCIDEYLRRRAFKKADALAWQRFSLRPEAEAFAVLMQVAATTGTQEATRERALDHLWAMVRQEESSGAPHLPAWQAPIRTELVRLFLAGQEDDNAWEAFNGGPVAASLWSRMAAVRGKTHPRDALALYQRLLPMAVELGRSASQYDEAFDVVRAIGQLRVRLDEWKQFAAELTEIRATYRAKRNFIKLLDTLG